MSVVSETLSQLFLAQLFWLMQPDDDLFATELHSVHCMHSCSGWKEGGSIFETRQKAIHLP